MRTPLLAIAFLLPAACLAQTGSVSGTITCSDTNLPAHYASIALEPVREVAPPEEKPAPKPTTRQAPAMITLARTHLDGTFQISAVKPGRYYVVVQNPGYLSPASQFTQEQINHPTAALKEIIDQAIPVIVVSPNTNSPIALSLVRAASISGTLRFEDGSAAAGLSFQFERKDKDGKFIPVTLDADGPDDQGHFRANGVPKGEYRMSLTLALNEQQVDGVFGGNHATVSRFNGGLSIYYGDTFHKQDAKILKIEGSESLQADITIPTSKIHAITGSLIDARSGHVINAGTVNLLEPGITETFTTAKVAAEEPIFHFEYVPEGSYTVSVKDARDLKREEIPYPAGSFGTRNYKETTLRRYAAYEAPLVIQTDLTGLNLALTPVKATANPTSEE